MAHTLSPVPRRCLVDPRDLAGELASLWRDCDAAEDGALCRGLTTNLIVVADAEDEAEVEALLGDFVRWHPCRAFLALGQDGAGHAPLHVELSAVERRLGAGRQTVLEQVTLRVAPGTGVRAAGLIRPLLLDLPAYLVWWSRRAPDSGDALWALARLVRAVVFDSSRTPLDPGQRAAVGARAPGEDLAERRAQPWRRALAEAFECAPFDPTAETRAVLSAGTAGDAITAALRRTLEQRLAAEVSIEPQGGDGLARLAVAHGPVQIEVVASGGVLRVHVTDGSVCRLPWDVPAGGGSLGRLVAAAIRSH